MFQAGFIACRFCGRKREVRTTRGNEGWVVICTHCGYEIEEEEDQQEE